MPNQLPTCFSSGRDCSCTRALRGEAGYKGCSAAKDPQRYQERNPGDLFVAGEYEVSWDTVIKGSCCGDLSLPDDDAVRGDFPMFDGLVAYFPNALAEVAKVSKIGNDQHNPGQPMHWARNKSTDHENKIVRHLCDAGKLDGRGVRHTARLAWRALAMLQEELERDEQLPPSRASTDRPW